MACWRRTPTPTASRGTASRWRGPLGLNLKATWARRDGDNSNPTVNGRDQDGSLDKNRWWLTASLPF